MQLIPAIDIIDGKCVRLTNGDYSLRTVYSDSPVDMARRFEALGYQRLHVVDLDGAKSKHVVNIETLRQITASTSLIVDFGGGIKSDDDIRQAFDAGAAMVTVGSVAVSNPDLMERWLKVFGTNRIILGADVRNGFVCVNGWKEDSREALLPFLQRYINKGVTKVLCTDIARDGTLNGPAVDLYKEVLKAFPGLQLIASGGVSCDDDLRQLEAAGLPAVVFGKAFYEGMITPPQRGLYKRIIPCLDVKDGLTVKGTCFENLRQAGDPVELGKAYSDAGADELVFLDIAASHEGRKTFTDVVRRVAKEINIPFTVGGGINELDDVSRLLDAGADKVSINSAALSRPRLITEITRRYGSQVCVVAIDATPEASEISEDWHCYTHGGRQRTDRNLFEWAREAQERGAGEILFTSMAHDGTKQGFANEALRKLSETLTIPVIASGGAGRKEHFRDAFLIGKADAALAASVFHFGEIAIPDLKRYLHDEGLHVRL